MKLVLGADPELFFVNHDGKYISSIGKIGGSKEEPRPIGNQCAVQEDNVAVEFNIPPCDSADKFVAAIRYNLEYLENQAKAMGLHLSVVASANFTEDQLQDRAAKVFGCTPDFNAWTGEENPRPFCRDRTLRSAGGHVHVQSELDKTALIKAMDLYIGSTLAQKDPDTRRRELYGKAGAYRPKFYGVEYRAASNYWLTSDDLMKWVYHQSERAVDFVEKGDTFNGLEVLIQDSINKADKASYAQLNEMFQIE